MQQVAEIKCIYCIKIHIHEYMRAYTVRAHTCVYVHIRSLRVHTWRFPDDSTCSKILQQNLKTVLTTVLNTPSAISNRCLEACSSKRNVDLLVVLVMCKVIGSMFHDTKFAFLYLEMRRIMIIKVANVIARIETSCRDQMHILHMISCT